MIALPPPQPPGPHLCVGALGARRGRRQGPPSLRRYLPPPLALRPVSPTPIPSPPPDHAHAGPLQAGFAPPPPPTTAPSSPPLAHGSVFRRACFVSLSAAFATYPQPPLPPPPPTHYIFFCVVPPASSAASSMPPSPPSPLCRPPLLPHPTLISTPPLTHKKQRNANAKNAAIPASALSGRLPLAASVRGWRPPPADPRTLFQIFFHHGFPPLRPPPSLCKWGFVCLISSLSHPPSSKPKGRRLSLHSVHTRLARARVRQTPRRRARAAHPLPSSLSTPPPPPPPTLLPFLPHHASASPPPHTHTTRTRQQQHSLTTTYSSLVRRQTTQQHIHTRIYTQTTPLPPFSFRPLSHPPEQTTQTTLHVK